MLNLELLRQTAEDNPFQTIRDLTVVLGVHHSCIACGLAEFGKIKNLERFVPHNLSQFDLDRRVDACLSLLTLHQRRAWLDHLITGDDK